MNSSEPAKHSANRLESFRHAFAGWYYLLKTQPNARIHIAATMAVVAMGLWLELETTQWAILWLAIGLVIAAECFNSAIEAVVDLASPQIHPLAKAAKDMCAGGVLAGACAAAIAGLLILGPPLLVRLIDWVMG
ncbi:MAG: diacylglycerol kinase family protein [Anaerolineae bacterium]|nr:diacylglycerol kinase family protein [Anaerolineae bacterium]